MGHLYRPHKQGSRHRGRSGRECRRQGSAVKCCRLAVTRPAHSCTLCGYGQLPAQRETEPGGQSRRQQHPLNSASSFRPQRSGHEGRVDIQHRVLSEGNGRESWGDYDRGTGWTCTNLFLKRFKKLRQFFTPSVISADSCGKGQSRLLRETNP